MPALTKARDPLLAIIAIVPRAALEANPDAKKPREAQEEAFRAAARLAFRHAFRGPGFLSRALSSFSEERTILQWSGAQPLVALWQRHSRASSSSDWPEPPGARRERPAHWLCGPFRCRPTGLPCRRHLPGTSLHSLIRSPLPMVRRADCRC